MGCLKNSNLVHQYILPEIFDNWIFCREECYNRGTKV